MTDWNYNPILSHLLDELGTLPREYEGERLRYICTYGPLCPRCARKAKIYVEVEEGVTDSKRCVRCKDDA